MDVSVSACRARGRRRVVSGAIARRAMSWPVVVQTTLFALSAIFALSAHLSSSVYLSFSTVAQGQDGSTTKAKSTPAAKPALKPNQTPAQKPTPKPDDEPDFDTKPNSPAKNDSGKGEAGKGEAGGPGVDTRVVATVGGVPVTMCEVQREVRRVLPGGETPPDVKKLVQEKAVEQLIDRQLVLAQLALSKQAATKQEVDLLWQRMVASLQQRGVTLADHLRASGLDEPALRRQIGWQLSWDRYLERYLTDENFERFFNNRRRDFDGTEVRVAHILLKVEPADSVEALKETRTRAEQIRAEIEAKKTTFAEAAGKHSTAPTAKMGGEVGWIRRRDPMPESFSKEAFALEVGAVSKPVETAFGVHLIHCLEVKPGKGDWKSARNELEPALVQYLFEWLAGRSRADVKVERMKVE